MGTMLGRGNPCQRIGGQLAAGIVLEAQWASGAAASAASLQRRKASEHGGSLQRRKRFFRSLQRFCAQ